MPAKVPILASMAATTKVPWSTKDWCRHKGAIIPAERKAVKRLRSGSSRRSPWRGRIQKLSRFITVISTTTLNSIMPLHWAIVIHFRRRRK